MFYKQDISSNSDNRFSKRDSRDTKRQPRHTQYETRRPPEKEMIFGIRAVMEAVDAGKTLDKILIRRDMSSSIGRELMDKLTERGLMTSIVQRVPAEKLNQFTDKAAMDVQTAMLDLKGMKGLVFDLRENPGGLLEEAVKIVSLFVPKGTTV